MALPLCSWGRSATFPLVSQDLSSVLHTGTSFGGKRRSGLVGPYISLPVPRRAGCAFVRPQPDAPKPSCDLPRWRFRDLRHDGLHLAWTARYTMWLDGFHMPHHVTSSKPGTELEGVAATAVDDGVLGPFALARHYLSPSSTLDKRHSRETLVISPSSATCSVGGFAWPAYHCQVRWPKSRSRRTKYEGTARSTGAVAVEQVAGLISPMNANHVSLAHHDLFHATAATTPTTLILRVHWSGWSDHGACCLRLGSTGTIWAPSLSGQ